MSNQPARRQPGDYGIIGPLVLITGVVALIGFWPAMVWHGYTDSGGWRWDIHSTWAELVYLGVIGFTGILVWLGLRPEQAVRAARPKRERSWPPPRYVPVTPEHLPPPPPSVCVPACCHFDAVPVENLRDPDAPPWAWLCPDPPQGCGRQLDAGFGRLMRPCCGSAPGTRHQYNCPHPTGDPR